MTRRKPSLFPRPDASGASRRPATWGSGSPFSTRSGYRRFAWVAVACMTGLTWILGLMNISAEGGPERSQVINGP